MFGWWISLPSCYTEKIDIYAKNDGLEHVFPFKYGYVGYLWIVKFQGGIVYYVYVVPELHYSECSRQHKDLVKWYRKDPVSLKEILSGV